ncbi:MBL fold metallo-hydrolase [Alkalicoccus luteus]|uniref:MBL fold metallo-hydrolase n=1 Tax=Alkalicoccus luteus TaxID=1237094 RepID=A0A969TTQ4_9BACI|nr:MBL fold metallo-hydrolase [Alkalicoccus luteus]NJP37898.1 MBL fold metallo-hydrolase [Alkalicoccus luteus]
MIEITTLATGSKGNCYHITDGSTALLLEAGIPYKEIRRKLNFQTTKIKGCLISHEHQDHCKAVTDVAKAGINIYMSQGTADALGATGHRIKPVKAKQQYQIGTWTILPFDVEHDVSEPYGFLLASSNGAKVLFATDTYYIRYKFKGLTHLLLECNYSLEILNENIATGRVHRGMKKRLIRSHFSLENVKEFLKANDLTQLQEIWLLHLSDSNSNEAAFKKEIQELTGRMVMMP